MHSHRDITQRSPRSLLLAALVGLVLAGCNGKYVAREPGVSSGDSPSGGSSSSVASDGGSSSVSSASSSSTSSSSSSSSSAESSSSSSVVSSSSSSTSSSSIPPFSNKIIDLDDRHQIGDVHWPNGDTSIGGQGQPVGTLKCNVTSLAYHVHSHMTIYLNGVAVAVPSHIGIVETSPTSHCTYSTHTHDLCGLLHVEAPAPGTFTLGQFFAIWGEPLSYTDIAGNPGLPVVVYLTDNGVATQYTGDLAAIELLSHREITIQIGTPITEIPRYTWSEM